MIEGALKVGVQADTEVTDLDAGHRVTQVYCSAIPVGYSQIGRNEWEPFARLILNATYEATFRVAIQNFEKTQCPKLFLTLVGGGVFGNELSWILDAIRLSCMKFRNIPLDVRIVSYGRSIPVVDSFCRSLA